MKLDVYAHCSIDHIHTKEKTSILAGGSACYCGIMARHLGADVRLVTRYGRDFAEYTVRLDDEKINHASCICNTPTTSFEIWPEKSPRELVLKNTCEPLQYVGDDSDGIIASPIFCEIDFKLYETLRKTAGFVFIDPQGFIRVMKNGKIVIVPVKMDFTGVDAIKVDKDEMRCLTNCVESESIRQLQKKGVQHILYTNEYHVTLYVKDRAYSLNIPKGTPADMVGLGDILSAAFCTTMMKEKDSLWAFCFACGAVQAACESGNYGLDKIPKKRSTVTNASYFYNTVDFKHI
ncbi:MAG: PfkB domain-containing protein [Cenarchaeum symbiont of Oopsacas minuta]|nr:PfkB domain-containing protein [Cenarchaeum symbiont of Oopsacas minuta]